MARVRLVDVSKVYKGNVRAVSDFNLDVKDGEFIVFVGPSGCGKSTTLRMIAGLEEITSGKIFIDDVLANNLEPKDRDIAMVFQNYALYPHMSVFDNLSYSLKCHHVDNETIKTKVDEVAKLLNISELLERKPKELSGGQRQRVALGRCLIRNPKVFLFDEPLSNLDAKLRVLMRSEISKLHKQVNGTFIYVTHDQTEAMTMGDRIVVMKDGFVQQIDSPVNLYEYPVNIFVATFLGSPQMNIFDVKLVDDKLYFNDEVYITLNEKIKNKLIEGYNNQNLKLGIRPSDFLLSDSTDYDFKVDTIELVEKLGSETLIYVNLPGREDDTIMSVKLDMNDELRGPIYIKVNKDKIHLFNDKEESILKINEHNYLPVTFKVENDYLIINDKYVMNDFKNRCVLNDLSISDNGYLRIPSNLLKTSKTKDEDLHIEVVVKAKDIRSNNNVYFARDTKNNVRITFITDKNENYHVDEKVSLYFSIDDCFVCDENHNIISISASFNKPIIESIIEKHNKDYYLMSEDKSFVKKNKYLLVEKIYELKNDMLLVVTNQLKEEMTLKVKRDDNYFAGMLIYTKFLKRRSK